MFAWKNVEKKDIISARLFEVNNFYAQFLITCSWLIYFIGAIVLISTISCQYRELRTRHQDLELRIVRRRAAERPPQKRRPGVKCREHELFRSILKNVRKYTGYPQDFGCYVFRETNTGSIYGEYIRKKKSITAKDILKLNEKSTECYDHPIKEK